MISNLRARSIQGYVTDSAGNVIRNSSITISRNNPNGSQTSVDRVDSDDEGYFISNPLPNGVYDIFESGIRTSKIIHSPDNNSIQCFKALKDNYYENDITPFSVLVEDDNLNAYKYFLQIEPEDISVDVFGNMFPIYDVDLSVLNEGVGELYSMKNFLNLRSDSRITVSRFDIEYYLPMTATQSMYRRIKWAGVPGVRFKKDSKLVVPLDYYSIVANNPFKISNNGSNFTGSDVYIDPITVNTVTVKGDSDVSAYLDIYNTTGIGDIIKLTISGKTWYGIVLSKASYAIVLEKWNSSRFVSTGSLPARYDNILTMKVYHGMFQGMTSMSSTVSEYFNVSENISQQNLENELYNYEGV